MLNLPFYLPILFGITVILALGMFYRASQYSNSFLGIALIWISFQSLLAWSGFYLNTTSFPPRFPFLVVPPVLLIAVLFLTRSGRQFLDQLDLPSLTLFHIVRVPVELVLYGLFMAQYVPHLMTFEGRNFDILSGLTAPLVYYFGFVQKKARTSLLLIWNLVCLALLLNIVVNAVLSAPTPLQQFAFDQPNVGILYFPFMLLPSFVVPSVLLAHLTAIRSLLRKE
jgi:hypothetical protein